MTDAPRQLLTRPASYGATAVTGAPATTLAAGVDRPGPTNTLDET